MDCRVRFLLFLMMIVLLLVDLAGAAKELSSKEGSKSNQSKVSPFGMEDEETDDMFTTKNCPFLFGGIGEIVHTICDLLKCLRKECDALNFTSFDLVQHGLWPLLNILLNFGNMTLMESTIEMMDELLHRHCLVRAPKELHKLMTMLFAILKHPSQGLNHCKMKAGQLLDLMAEQAPSSEVLTKLFQIECAGLWHSNFNSYPSEYLVHLDTYLSLTANEVSSVNVLLPQMLSLNLASFQVALAHLVVNEVRQSEVWSIEKEKLTRIDTQQGKT